MYFFFHRGRIWGAALAICTAFPAVNAAAPPVLPQYVFPSDAGVVDVTKPPYNAKADGIADDGDALQAALSAYPSGNRIIYLPNGIYRVSRTLRWPKGKSEGGFMKRTILQGQSQNGAIIRLTDKVPGFDDPQMPRAVVYTGCRPAQRFRNGIRSLTVDTGRDNPGAIGVQYIANNQGSVHDLTVRSGDGKGVIGLDLGYTDEQGPCLIADVTVEGFDEGISTRHAVDSVVLERIHLRNQNRIGFINDGQCLSICGLHSVNPGIPAFVNRKGAGLVTLIDSDLRGSGEAAVVNEAGLFARNVTTQGYTDAIRSGVAKNVQQSVRGPKVEEWVSHPAAALYPGTSQRSLNLPIKETPAVAWGNPAMDWAGPQQFGGVADGSTDNTAALQKAIDSGKTTVYLPNGNWKFDGEVLVRGSVARIIGCEAKLSGKGTLKVVDGTAPVIRIERLDNGYTQVKIEQATRRTLVLSSISMGGGGYEAHAGSGNLFLEDVVGTPWRFFKGQNVWARQLNAEGRETKIVNDGATLWILGLKSESDGTLVESRGGAKTEVIGGFAYANTDRPKMPMFVVQDSSLSFTIGEWVIRNAPFLEVVAESRGRERRVLHKGDVPSRGGGSMILLFVAGGKF